MGEKKLTGEIQLFIVQQLALFEKPTAVQTMLREIHGKELALPSILHYDIKNPTLPKKWKDIFESTRAKFLEDTSDIPIASKAFRLKELDRLYHKGKSSKLENPVDQRATLEQAAKESGDVYTNKQKLEIDVSNLTDEELESLS